MILKKLALTNFRSYPRREFYFSPGVTLVVGPNTVGKTNLLEGIYFLAVGSPLWAGVEADLIRWGATWGRVEGVLASGADNYPSVGVGEGGETGLEIFIEKSDGNRSRKQFKINGVKKSRGDFQGVFRVVVFSPEALRLVSGNPGRRREYLDRVLAAGDYAYLRSVSAYRQVIRNRNQVLWEIRERGASPDRLAFWDERLFALGEEISGQRQTLVTELNRKLGELGLGCELNYRPSLLDRGRAERRLRREVALALTLWGPHRDDFDFWRVTARTAAGADGGQDLASFGSRGEQRAAVFSLCLAELEVATERSGTRPVLLLDDIFSELDDRHRQRILEVLPKQQVVITSAESDLAGSGLVKADAIVELRNDEV